MLLPPPQVLQLALMLLLPLPPPPVLLMLALLLLHGLARFDAVVDPVLARAFDERRKS